MPKLRVAELAGAASAAVAETAMRKVRMGSPSTLVVNDSLTGGQEQRTLPDPALLTLHLAPPATSTSPEPMMLTSAVPLECPLTPPEPAIETFSCCVWTAAAS